MIGNEIKVKCKKCGRQAPANSFVLDAEDRMMICPNCIKDRRNKVVINKELQEKREEENRRPAGWDAEDEYLEKTYRHKVDVAAGTRVERIDSEKVKYSCPHCKYRFVYNTVKKTPATCPYCSSPIFRMNF
jgi:DNA-directed RNA polymerase subunit RPC12/RpoP